MTKNEFNKMVCSQGARVSFDGKTKTAYVYNYRGAIHSWLASIGNLPWKVVIVESKDYKNNVA